MYVFNAHRYADQGRRDGTLAVSVSFQKMGIGTELILKNVDRLAC